MSGYLQRLATSAARTERRVQPLVGGMYTRQPEPMIEEREATVVTRASDHRNAVAVSHFANTPTAHDGLTEQIEASKTHVQQRLVEPVVTPIAEESSKAAKSAKVHDASHAGIGKTRVAADPIVFLKQFLERDDDSRRDVEEEHHDWKARDEAEKREAVASSRAETLVAPVSTGVERAVVRQPVVAAQTASPARSGGNDIQIHIGQIEVIAVPQQAAVRPAPAPVRRGPSLEEYLQRRDRRSR